jgi:hypothetical protein
MGGVMSTIVNADTSGGLKLTSDTSGELLLQSGGSTKLTVNSSGISGDGSGLTSLTSGNLTGALPAIDGSALTGLSGGIGYNYIINGTFGINQRAVTGTVTLAAGVYGHDRWKAGASGCTYTFATAANSTTITISAGSLLQVIEGVSMQSGTHTLSWTGTATAKIGGGSYSASGVTGTVTGGTNMTIDFSTGTLSLVKFESGSTATDFEQISYSQELALCHRYYLKLTTSFIADSTTGFVFNIQFPTEMRDAPDQTHEYPDGGVVNDVYHNSSAATPTFVPNGIFTNTKGMTTGYDFDGGFTAGNAYTTFWTFDSEID